MFSALTKILFILLRWTFAEIVWRTFLPISFNPCIGNHVVIRGSMIRKWKRWWETVSRRSQIIEVRVSFFLFSQAFSNSWEQLLTTLKPLCILWFWSSINGAIGLLMLCSRLTVFELGLIFHFLIKVYFGSEFLELFDDLSLVVLENLVYEIEVRNRDLVI